MKHFYVILLGSLGLAQPAAAQVTQAPPFVKVEAGPILQEKGNPLWSGAFNKDGSLLATGGMDGVIQVWEMGAKQKQWSVSVHKRSIQSVLFTPDGKVLVSAGHDKTVILQDAATGKEVFRFNEFKLPVLSMALSPNGETLAVGTGMITTKDQKPEVILLDLVRKKNLGSLDFPKVGPRLPDFVGLDFAPDGKTIALAPKGSSVQSWDLAKRARVASLDYLNNAGFPLCVAHAPDGQSVAAGFSHGDVVLLDARTWTKLASIPDSESIGVLSFSPDSRTLASAGQAGTVKLWDVTTSEVPEPILVRSEKRPARFVLFSPDGKTLAVGGSDGKLALYAVSRSTVPAVVAKKEAAKTSPQDSERLALVSTERSPPILTLLDLAEARLSQEVQLVERRALDAVLAEQKLSLAGFVKHDQVVQVGKLLGAQLFGVVETDKVNKQAVGLVIFHAPTGVRLWDATLPGGNVGQTVEAVALAVRGAVNKLRRQGKDLATVCLTTVRNVDLPRSQDALCDLVGQLLERGLVASPNLALLERTRLDQVLKEQSLPTGKPLGQVLASLVRIELEVGRAPDGKGLRGTAFLVSNRGEDLGKATAVVADPDPTLLAKALLEEVAKPLKAQPAMVVDRVREVLRLSAEAEFFAEHKDWRRSLKARQSACALKPDDLRLRTELAYALIQTGRAIHELPSNFRVTFATFAAKDKLAESLELMLQGTEELIDLAPRQNHLTSPGRVRAAWYNLVTYLDAVNKPPLINKPPLDGQALALRKALQERNLALQELSQDVALALVEDKSSYEKYSDRLGYAVLHEFSRRSGLTDEQFSVYQRNLVARWLTAAEKWGTLPLPPETVRATFVLLRGLEFVDDSDRARKYRQALLRSQDPHVLLYDRFAGHLQEAHKLAKEAADNAAAGKASVGKAAADKAAAATLVIANREIEQVRDLRLFVEKLLLSEQTQGNAALRFNCYHAAKEAIESLPYRKGVESADREEMHALCRFMIRQNDAMPLLVQSTLHQLHESNQSQARQGAEARLGLIDELLAKVDGALLLHYAYSPTAMKVERDSFKKRLLEDRRVILAKLPDLDQKVVRVGPQAETLIDIADVKPGLAKAGLAYLLEPVVHQGCVYVVGVEHRSPTNKLPEQSHLQLLRFSLRGGAKEELGKVEITTYLGSHWASPPSHRLSYRWKFASAACIHDGHYILGTQRGIVVFSLDGKKVTHLHTGTGLPSNHVHQLACLDHKVYAGLGEPTKEGYLIAHDLKTGQTSVLASSRRKDALSPLDNTAPLRVTACRADAKRGRVLAFVWVGESSALSKLNGVWQVDAQTGRPSQLHNLRAFGSTTSGDLEWASPIVDDKLVLALYDATYLMDLTNDKLEKLPVAAPSTNRLYSFLEPRLPHLVAFLKPGDRTIQLRGDAFIHEGRLWTGYPFGRIGLDGTNKEAFPNLRAKYLPTFRPWEGFQIAGDKMLIADQHALWLAPLPSRK